MAVFRAKFITIEPYDVQFISDGQFDTDFGTIIEVGHGEKIEEYDGVYTVEPLFENQTLETSGKKMADDVTVNEIAVRVVQNLSGGMTVTIGG